MNRTLILAAFLAGILLCFNGIGFAQGVQQRIPQAVIVNGQQTEGVTVMQNGMVQTVTCPSPQPYTAVDQSSSGWACLDESTGTWLLNAVPPQSSTVYTQPPAYYQEAPGYYGYPYYPYDYYPYGYLAGPEFYFGFGGGHHFEGHHFEGRGGFERHGGGVGHARGHGGGRR